jgi:hypothetical protein
MENSNANGCYISTNKFRFSCTNANSDETKNGFTFIIGSGTTLYTGFYDNERHIIELNNNGGNNPSYAKIDDNTYELQIVTSVEGGNSIFLFAQNATTIRPSKYKIYSSKIYEGDVLVQDLIPVKKDGKGYMYDKVSKKLFSNGGTGEFIIGADKYYQGLKFTAEEAGSTVSIAVTGSAQSVSLETSTDGVTWSNFIVGTTTITLTNVGDYVYFRAKSDGNSTINTSEYNYNYFVMSGQIAASGNIMSLLD